MNQPLQNRAGANIGVAPLPGLQIYQQHANAPYITLGQSETVLWEGQPNCVRAVGSGSKPKFAGYLLSEPTGMSEIIEGDLIFIDADGFESLAGDFFIDLEDGFGPITLDANGKLEDVVPVVLCPGEKIVARITSGNPDGRVRVLAFSKDLKVKGQGKGGISDGGVECIRLVLQPGQISELLPRSGESLEQPAILGFLPVGVIYFNAADGPATIDWGFEDENGVQYFPESFQGDTSFEGVLTDSFSSGEGALAWLNTQAGAKTLVRFSPEDTPPTGRVTVMVLGVRNDVASDLNQES